MVEKMNNMSIKFYPNQWLDHSKEVTALVEEDKKNQFDLHYVEYKSRRQAHNYNFNMKIVDSKENYFTFTQKGFCTIAV